MNQEDIERIEGYVNNVLPEEQRQAVEQRMATDEEFREAVEFQRNMHEHFQDEGRQRFRAMVQGVMEDNPVLKEPPKPPSPGNSRPSAKKWMGLLAILLIAGFLVWTWNKPGPTAPTGDKPGPTELSPGNSTEPIEKELPEKIEPSKPKDPEPVAMANPANFVPNASMEAFVHGGMMSEGIDLKITSPLNGTEFTPGKNSTTAIRFTGTVEDMGEEEPVSFVLSVFNNRDVNKPLVSLPFDLQKDASGKFRFDLYHGLNVPRGLYYFTIDDRAGNRVYTGKFTIGHYKK